MLGLAIGAGACIEAELSLSDEALRSFAALEAFDINPWLNPNQLRCSSELPGHPCSELIDGTSGTCQEGEWISDGDIRPWVEYQWKRPVVVERVELLDSACAEQILRGHIEFSDGSPPVQFGPLDNSGTLPAVVDFSPRTITWARVVVDETQNRSPATPNPGFGEIRFTGTSGRGVKRKVLVLNFDPFMYLDTRLHDYYGWHDPADLEDAYRHWMGERTGGAYEFEIVDSVTLSQFPVKADGFQYTTLSYRDCIENDNCHAPDLVDYQAILADHDICNRFNTGEFDQVWLFGGPYFGYWESTLTGPESYYYNSDPIPNTACGHLLPIMGFNYELPVEFMVHNLGHATEATLSRVYGNGVQNSIEHAWNRFWMNDLQSPDYDYSGCGSIHFTPNGTEDSDYNEATPAPSYCDDFFNYPQLASDPAAATEPVDCTAWGCAHEGYLDWWFEHIPQARGGTGDDRKYVDWWRYIADPNAALETDLSRGDARICSTEHLPGWCDNLVDGRFGTCNEGEWATDNQPTGTATIEWEDERIVSRVTLYDRACPEQVLSGHLSFADGSPDVAFGALEDTGTTPTVLAFAPRTTSGVTVHIDSSSGANPGLGEVIIDSVRADDELAIRPEGITCTSELAKGWCERVDDDFHGTCGEFEWATDGQPTGSMTMAWEEPVTINRVTLYDRACADQVLEGYISFDNMTPSVPFGPLAQTGTVLDFGQRTITGLTVHITDSSGTNPGLAEVDVAYVTTHES